MYIDCVDRLKRYIDCRFPEPTLKMSEKEFKLRSIERYISETALLTLYDRISVNPAEVLFGMLYYYNSLLHKVSKRNYDQKSTYNTYIRVLMTMKKFIEEEEGL